MRPKMFKRQNDSDEEEEQYDNEQLLLQLQQQQERQGHYGEHDQQQFQYQQGHSQNQYQQQYQQQPQQHQHQPQHQPITIQSLIQQLQRIYSSVIQHQSHQLNQLLNLQRLLNHTLTTNNITREDLIKQEKKNNNNKEEKKEFNIEKIQQKISKLIEETGDVVVVVEEQDKKRIMKQKQMGNDDAKNNPIGDNSKTDNTVKQSGNYHYKVMANKKLTVKTNNQISNNNISSNMNTIGANRSKQKPLLYKLEPNNKTAVTALTLQTAKKPPVPVVNRAIINNDNMYKMPTMTKYIPPRNKNEVTGKVTQTKIVTQEKKVFKPQKVVPNPNSKVNSSNNISSNNNTITSMMKMNSSVEKSTGNNNNNNNQSTMKSTSFPTASHSSLNPHLVNAQDSNSISQYKNLRAATNNNLRLKQFSKPVQQLYQQSSNKKKSMSYGNTDNTTAQTTQRKKQNFKQLIEKYQQQEMGHRNLEEKRRLQYIKKLNNFALSINSSQANDISHSILSRKWNNSYESIFQFNQVLENIEQDVNKIEEQDRNDLRIEAKEVYKVQAMLKLAGMEIDKIMDSTQIHAPDKIALTFKPIENTKDNNKKNNNNNNDSQLTPPLPTSLQLFYKNMVMLLQQTKQNESLSTKDLSLLRVMSEIGLYEGKKSPLVIKSDQFQQWKDSYNQVDSN